MIGVYAGSFDPVTNGHMWVISRAAETVGEGGKLIIAIGKNSDKKSLFTFEERKEMVLYSLARGMPHSLFERCEITSVENEFIVHFADRHNARFIFRGIRNVKDFDYEVGIQQVNRDLCPHIETIFFLPPADISGISSSIVKGMVGFKDWEKALSKYVSQRVVEELYKKKMVNKLS